MDQVASADLGENSRDSTEPEVQVSHYNGALLSGQLTGLEDGKLLVKTDYSQQPISCQLAGVLEIKFLKSATLRDTQQSILEFRGTRLHGQLAPAGPDGKLGWQPVGVPTPACWPRTIQHASFAK